jgi:hypothetical protein
VENYLTNHTVGEGVDDIRVGDIGELTSLLGEVLNVLSQGLIGPLLVVTLVPRVVEPGVHALKVPNEG